MSKWLPMLNRRVPFRGLLAVLLALIAQLGTGASVPQIDPLTRIIGAESLCHASGGAGDKSPAPIHPLDCPICVVVHPPAVALVPDMAALRPTAVVVALRSEIPPHSTAPPSTYRTPGQPRAPPTTS
jgi:hypothetical protein